MKRKIVVLALAMAFILSMTSPVQAGDPGEYFNDAAEWETEFFAEAAYWLGRMGIFIGDAQANLLPDDPLTRAQMAVVLSRMTGQEHLATALSGSNTSWIDDAQIPSWARGYMVLSEAQEWFIGHPDGSVGPNDHLTFAQIAVLLARVTDNEDLAVGPWPASAMIVGAAMGLFDDIELALPDVPILRGEMVSATLKAMLVDTFLNRDAADGGPGTPLMGTHFSDDYDEWVEEVPVTVTGEWTEYLPLSQRITVAGGYYHLHMDNDNVEVTVVLNDKEHTWAGAFFDALKGKEVTITLNSYEEVIKLEGVLDTYADVFLTAVDVHAGEEDFGTITVDGDTLDADDETVILLDGAAVTLAELEGALDAFMDAWETDRAIATVRTFDHVPGNRAIWASVITEHIVQGEVTAKGTDATGGFGRIDGDKYYYGVPLTAADFTVGDTVILLLDSADRARLILEVPLVTEASEFFGMLVTFEVNIHGEGIATFEWSDGTVNEYPYDATVWTLETDDVGWVWYVVHDGSDFTTLAEPTSATQAVASQELITVTSAYIQTHDGVDTTTLIRSHSVFAFDDTISTPAYVEVSDLLGKNVDVYVDSDGEVGFVIAVHPDEVVAAAAIEAADWSGVVVGRNVVDIAQLMADSAVDGTTVTLLSTSHPTVVAADGEAVIHGGSELVFRVTKGAAEADTGTMLVAIIPWGVHADNSSAASADQADGTALIELVVQNSYGTGLIGFGMDDIELYIDGLLWFTLTEWDATAQITITGFVDNLDGTYAFTFDPVADGDETMDIRVDGVIIETGAQLIVTGN